MTDSQVDLAAAFTDMHVEGSGVSLGLEERMAQISMARRAAHPLSTLERRLRKFEDSSDFASIERTVWPAHAGLFNRPVDRSDQCTLDVMDIAVNALHQLGQYERCREQAHRVITRSRLLEEHCVNLAIYNIVQRYGDAVKRLRSWPGTEEVFRWLYEENRLTEGALHRETLLAGDVLLHCLVEINPRNLEAKELAIKMVAATRDLPGNHQLRMQVIEQRGVIHAAHNEWREAARCLSQAFLIVEQHPSIHQGESWFYSTKAMLGQMLLNSGDPTAALPLLELAYANIDTFSDVDPSWPTLLPKMIKLARAGTFTLGIESLSL